ncbi:MAG: SCO family protein [Hypericibacter sp.]
MPFLRVALVAALLVPALAPAASSHSLDELQQQLTSKDKYFQAADSEAPGFTLQDADGRKVGLTDFHGKVVVLNFIYTHCPDVCPLHSERIAEIQKMINGTPMKDLVEFITITTDPGRDNGPVLRDYGAAHGLDPLNWVFLTTTPEQPEDTTRKIAEAYGLKFVESSDGLQMHAVVTHVIDQDGRLRARFHGLDFDPVDLVVYVNALTNGISKPHEDAKPGLWDRIKALFQ